ncbi:MAG TPA: hypothetical protein VKU39_12010 [Streptosporangiaceae bacterium]|nr:hypothetical protein [Streptosporangiaceae bacterium]
MPIITLLTGAAVGVAVLVASMLATAAPPARTAAAAPAVTVTRPSPLPAPASVPARAHYSGEVNRARVSVAIWVRGGHTSAYLCNGNVIETWFKGTAFAGRLSATGKHGARLEASYEAASAAGYVIADGIRYTFSAPRVLR